MTKTRRNTNNSSKNNTSKFKVGQDCGSMVENRKRKKSSISETTSKKQKINDIEKEEEEEQEMVVDNSTPIITEKLNSQEIETQNNSNNDNNTNQNDFTLDEFLVTHIQKKDITLQQIVERVYAMKRLLIFVENPKFLLHWKEKLLFLFMMSYREQDLRCVSFLMALS